MPNVSQYLRVLVCGAAMSVAASATAQGKDELWEVTMKMEMAGMPMPAQTQRICQQAGKKDESRIPQQENCKTSDVKQSGSKVTFKIQCRDGADQYGGTGEVTSGKDTYSGVMKLKGTVDGEPMDMTQTFSGKRAGNCTYEDPGRKVQAQMDASKAEVCGESLKELASMLFTPGQYCADQKPQFCARVSGIAKEMAEPAAYSEVRRKYPDIDGALRLCGQDPAAMHAAVCKRAAGKKDWAFVAEQCEADAKALAATHCDGRSYTAAMASEYAPICQRHATDMQRAYTAQARTGAKPGATDGIKEGASKLKKFLKF